TERPGYRTSRRAPYPGTRRASRAWGRQAESRINLAPDVGLPFSRWRASFPVPLPSPPTRMETKTLTFLYQREGRFSGLGLATPDTDMRLRYEDWYPACPMSG